MDETLRDSNWDKGQSVLLDLLPVGTLVITEDFTIRAWNQALEDWTEIRQTDAVGSVLSDLFPSVKENRYFNRLQQVFSTGLPATYSPAFHKHFLPIPARHGIDDQLMIQQTEVRLLQMSEKLALISIVDVSFQYLQLERLKHERAELVSVRDALCQMNQQLSERNRELDEFTYIASHDLQEPLRKIISFGQLFQDRCGENVSEEGKKCLDYMSDASRRMKQLITDLLELSRASRKELSLQPTEISTCVDRALDSLEVRAQETKAEFYRDSLPNVSCDALLVTQLYQNLIGNALKFVADKTPIVEVTAEEVDGIWVFGVKDNGIGIATEYSDQVFSPFQRLHGRDKYEGTGIGLSICRKAVLRHGGEIWVESVPGEGSHFKFTLAGLKDQLVADSVPLPSSADTAVCEPMGANI